MYIYIYVCVYEHIPIRWREARILRTEQWLSAWSGRRITSINKHVDICMHIYISADARFCGYIYIYIYIYGQPWPPNTYMHTCACAHTHVRTRTYVHTNAHMHAWTHTHTHAHTRGRAHARTHTHAYIYIYICRHIPADARFFGLSNGCLLGLGEDNLDIYTYIHIIYISMHMYADIYPPARG